MVGNRRDAVECLKPLQKGQIDPQVIIRSMSQLTEVSAMHQPNHVFLGDVWAD